MNSTDSRVLMTRADEDGPHHLPGPAGRSGELRTVAAVNLGLRFCVELATFASLGYWGASVDGSTALRTSLAVAAPLMAIMAWSRLLAPTASARLAGPAALAVELSIFATATWALVASGAGLVGPVYASLAVLNSILTRWLGQYAPADAPAPERDRPW